MKRNRSAWGTSTMLSMSVILSPSSATHAADIRLTAAEAGITPEAIVIAGAAPHAAAIVQGLGRADADMSALAALREHLTQATAMVVTLEQRLGLNPSDVEARNAYQAATAQVTQIRSQIAAAQSALLTLVTQPLTDAQRAAMQTFQSSASIHAPPDLRAASRTPEQWSALQDALLVERRALRLGTVVPEPITALLTAARAEPQVIAAAAELQQHLGAVQALFAVFAEP